MPTRRLAIKMNQPLANPFFCVCQIPHNHSAHIKQPFAGIQETFLSGVLRTGHHLYL